MGKNQFIARRLLEIEAVVLQPDDPFTWASGRKAPIYCDNRLTLSQPALRDEIIQAFVSESEAFQPFEWVAGVATAGIPHGALIAQALDLPFIYVRSKAKEHGRQNLIEGADPRNRTVLLVEDLISTGGSSLQAVEALRKAGAKVAGVLAVFTYGFEEAEQAFQAANCPVATLTDYPTLLEEAKAMNYIKPEHEKSLNRWREDPAHWPDN